MNGWNVTYWFSHEFQNQSVRSPGTSHPNLLPTVRMAIFPNGRFSAMTNVTCKFAIFTIDLVYSKKTPNIFTLLISAVINRLS